MRAARSLSTRMATLGGALALAASGLVGAVGIGLVATSTPAGATTTTLPTSNCNLIISGVPTPTPITPTVTADITPSPVSAGSPFSLSTLSIGSTLNPATNPTLAAAAGLTLSVTFASTLTATGATPASQPVSFSGNLTLPKPFVNPATITLNGSAGGYVASSSGVTSANVLLSGTGSLTADVIGTALTFNGPCTGAAPTQIASVPVVLPAAHVTNVIPNAGIGAGGTMVKIVGQNLGDPKSVDFGNTPAASFTSISPNVIEAVTPAGLNAPPNSNNLTQSTVAVRVVTAAGPPTLSSLDNFTYVDPTLGTIVTGVSPTVGSGTGGNAVTITGIGFNDPNGGPATAVMFGSVNQPNYNVVSDTEITTTAPPGTGIVNVTVIGNDGVTLSPTSPADRYNYDPGYFLGGGDGGVFSYGQTPGQANFYGSAGAIHLNKPIVGMATTPDGGGYWLVASDGGVFAYGDAYFYGSMGGTTLNAAIVGIASTPDGAGYWLVAADGGVFSFGDALFYGSMGGTTLAAPVVGIASTPDGAGYTMVAADGGVFAFGDAHFHGSLGSTTLAAPIVGMSATPGGGGYLLAGADGGVFAYGDATFSGSLGGTALAAPISGIESTGDGGGYWLVAQGGGVFNEGDAYFSGDLAGLKLNAPIIGLSAVQSVETPV